jgi:hypothetical protein
MQVPDSHIRVNVLSAVSNEGDLHFLTYTLRGQGRHILKALKPMNEQGSSLLPTVRLMRWGFGEMEFEAGI